MAEYNGFSAREVAAAQEWLRGEVGAGRREKPTACSACGQAEGVLELHTEDYSKPWGDHVGAFPLCYRCHMMVHHRRRSPAAWSVYRARVRRGWRCPPAFRRDFGRYVVPLLNRRNGPVCTPHDPQPVAVLDDIAAGTYGRARTG